jgi:hypothetical protein
MASVTPPPARVPLMQVAVLVTVIVLVANSAFFFLSGSYAQSRHSSLSAGEPLNLGLIRMWFLIMTTTVGGASLLAAIAPRTVGHALAAVTGVAAFVCGFGAAFRGMPGALTATLFVLGVLMPILTLRSLRGNRAAWSFLTVICAVLGVCLLFGAPKVRGIFEIGLWPAMIIPGLLAVAAASLTLVHRDYQSVASDDDTAAA